MKSHKNKLLTALLVIFSMLGSSSVGAQAQLQTFHLQEALSPKELTLRQALKMSLSLNYDLRQAKAVLAQIGTQKRQALAGLLPRLDLSANFTHNIPEQTAQLGGTSADLGGTSDLLLLSRAAAQTAATNTDLQRQLNAMTSRLENQARSIPKGGPGTVIQPENVFTATLNLKVPLFNPSALARTRNGFYQEKNSRLSLISLKNQLLKTTAIAYTNALSSRNLSKIAIEHETRMKKQFESAKDKVLVGLSSSIALFDADIAFKNATAQALESDFRYRTALGRLGAIISKSETFIPIKPDLGDFSLNQSSFETLLRKAQSKSPTLKIARGELSLAKASHMGAVLNFLPSFEVNARVNFTDNPGGFSPKNWTGALVFSGSVPIYDGGLKPELLRYARIEESKKQMNLLEKERLLAFELRSAQQKLKVEISKEQALAMAKKNAKISYELMLLRRQRGLVSGKELNDAAHLLLNAEGQLEISRHNIFQAEIELLSLSDSLVDFIGSTTAT